jgi:hypothetical protein
VPVNDVDAAKAFYERIGYHIDHDHRVSDELRFVQITPPGSCCSIVVGNGITSAPPGSAQGLQVVVDDGRGRTSAAARRRRRSRRRPACP